MLGPSGCGKTTTLRMIGGFEEPTEGRIFLGDQDVVGLPPYKRDVNTVFQSYALFPHMSIEDNVAFGLERKGVAKDQLRGRVAEMLELVGLSGFAKRKPKQLSGGQQQRVALGRALVNHPRVLLLDEPLGALDLKLRKNMQMELKRIQQEVGITFVHVTHDQEEAMTMADTIAVMNGGRIEQLGPPAELYERPATAFVAGFLGASNLLPGTVEGPDAIRLDDGTLVRADRERAHGPGGSRRASREDHDRSRRRCQRASRHDRRDRVHRSGHAGRRADGRRDGARFRTEHGCRWTCAQPGHDCRTELGAGVDVRRRPGRLGRRGGARMNPRLTRNELLRRGAAGGALLAFPSILAACGGGDDGGSAAGGELKDVLNFANWPFYIDVDKPTTLQDFTTQTRHQGELLRGDQRQRRVLREDPGTALAGRGHRPRHLRVHRQLALPGHPRQRGLGAEARQGASSRTSRTSSPRRRARRSTRTASTRCRGSRA